MPRVFPLCLSLIFLVSMIFVPLPAMAEEGGSGAPRRGLDKAEEVELFEAMDNGVVEARFIAKGPDKGRLVVRNKTDQPLKIKLPDAFASLPVLGQGQGGGGGFGGGGGGGGGFFNLPPEKVRKIDVALVCLEHGKPDPRSTMEYEIKPINDFTNNPKVIELCRQLGNGRYSQHAAQAAAWHLANDMSWEELASKIKRHATGLRQIYFTSHEIRAAMNIVADVESIVKESGQPSSESLAK